METVSLKTLVAEIRRLQKYLCFDLKNIYWVYIDLSYLQGKPEQYSSSKISIEAYHLLFQTSLI